MSSIHAYKSFHLLTFNYAYACFISAVLLCFHCIDARLYNWTIFGKTLDWSLIVACSSLITPTTIFNVTVTLPSANGTERHTFISNETRMDLNVSLPYDEGIGVSLQILEYEAGKASLIKILNACCDLHCAICILVVYNVTLLHSTGIGYI